MPEWQYLMKIAGYLFIYISVFIYLVFFINKDFIINNWTTYRCYPVIMPFASFFGKDTSENISGCLGQSFHEFFGILIKPFQYMIGIITKLLGDITEHINLIRTMTAPIRSFVKQATSMMYKKVENLMGMVLYSFLKINNLMKRVYANFRLAVYSLEASQMAIRSTWDGPIGGTVRTWAPVADFFTDFFCFGEETIILDRPISQISIGIGDIYGIFKFLAPKTLYNYRGVLISGNHLVYHNNKWTLVKETGSTKVDYNGKYIYSLLTHSHRIQIGSIIAADYEETDQLVEIQKNLCLKNLKSSDNIDNKRITPNLVSDSVKIWVENRLVRIDQIEVGSYLQNGNRVLGIAIVKTRIPTYNGYGIHNIVFSNKGWHLLENIVDKNYVTNNEQVYYNLITTNGYYRTEDYVLRDYIEFHAMDVYDTLTKMSQVVLSGL